MKYFNTIAGVPRVTSTHHQATNPRTEDLLWDAPVGTTQDLDDAVISANKAFLTWGKTTVAERQEVLRNMAEVIKENSKELTEIVMKETGKSALMASIEIGNTLGQMEYFIHNALSDEVTHEDSTVKIVTTHVPLGIVGAICPWNFPLILANIKVVCSLVTGNCVIVKPSPFTPYSVLKWVELSQSVLPPGVFSAINGGADIGAAMCKHPGIHKISFTGTIATGRKVMESSSSTLKKVTLELAGNDASIICPDVDIDKTVPKVVGGAFFNAGQMCVATKRVYVHKEIFDVFVAKFAEETKKMWGVAHSSADASNPSLFGPVSNKMQYDTVKTIVEDCKARGMKIVAGGEVGGAEAGATNGRGFWVSPTVVANPPEDSLLVQEEQFGPIIPIMSWEDEEEVLARANLDNAGLGATVYSPDLKRAERIARRLEAGTIWINMSEKPNPAAYFSGFKNSGIGGELGKQGLLSYSYTQCLQFSKE
ncbi:Aldehyde dehydrogenase [Zalerion maritima]|uniref:aldehyde dehydrogenase (NAD(+)) n=1 Tax=Zalerion maritima TaxID=339359 RepID=A0AAD5WY21_9PEZI|nr:Aldehyde dehydrogenase [Zalerion maritima]